MLETLHSRKKDTLIHLVSSVYFQPIRKLFIHAWNKTHRGIFCSEQYVNIEFTYLKYLSTNDPKLNMAPRGIEQRYLQIIMVLLSKRVRSEKFRREDFITLVRQFRWTCQYLLPPFSFTFNTNALTNVINLCFSNCIVKYFMFQMEPHLNKFSLNTLFQLNDFSFPSLPWKQTIFLLTLWTYLCLMYLTMK